MSTDTSPATHLQPNFGPQSTPITTPASHLVNSSSASFPDSNQSYSSGATHVDDSPSRDAPVQKGKNGATGPAEGKAKPHLCQICQRGFTTGGHLQRHQRIHTGVKAFKCPFPGCETRTSRQDNLQQHYRTHLSPTLRRGSGSAARQAVAAAMEAAGLKSSSTRAPRKSKGSANGTPSSTASAGHIPSPYQTPTSQAGPYAGYSMYDPQQYGGYPAHPLPPPGIMQTQSAASSRVPSPANGHSSGHSSVTSIPGHHQPPYFPQPYSPAYSFGGGMHQQPYRYGPGPYGPPSHHNLYSPGIAPEHQGHLYSPMQAGFPTHSRESSYNVINPGYNVNGYPPRTQTSTPLSQNHDVDDRYARRPSPRRRSPPDMLSQGVVDPANMSNRQMPAMQPSYGYGQPMQYGYNGPPHMQVDRDPQRNSISSMSDASGNGASEASAKPLH